jgi:hypothetical protein
VRMHRRTFVASSFGLLGASTSIGQAWAAGAATSPSTTLPSSGPGLVLTPGPAGWWDSERVSCPRVLREADGVWRMWYYGRDPTFNRAINLPSGRSGLATSKDGIHWERVRGPLTMGAVLEPSVPEERFDSGHVGITDVHRGPDGYVAWYLGGSRRPGDLGVPPTVWCGPAMRVRSGEHCSMSASRDPSMRSSWAGPRFCARTTAPGNCITRLCSRARGS